MRVGNREVSGSKIRVFFSSLLFCCFAGCGALGEKKPTSGPLAAPGDGCFNDFGPQMSRYVEGEIEADEWTKLWNCTSDSLKLFRDYARGSNPNGYQVEEIQNFVNTFLVTKQKVSIPLVKVLFQFKASFFGGAPNLITFSEVTTLLAFVDVLKRESTQLIPHLKARHRNPIPENLLPMADAITLAGHRISESLPKNGTVAFRREDLGVFLSEMGQLFGWNLAKNVERFHFGMKALAVGGLLDSIQTNEWDPILKAGFELGGPVLAMYSVDSSISKNSTAYLKFISSLLDRVEPVLQSSIAQNGNVVKFDVWDDILDFMPSEWFSWKKSVLKSSLRPVFSRILRAQTDQGFDRQALGVLTRLARDYIDSHSAISEVFSRYQWDEIRGVTPAVWASSVRDYQREVSESRRALFERLALLGEKFRPLHPGEDAIVSLPTEKHSRFNLQRLNLMQVIARHLIDVYAKDQANRRASTDDVLSLIREFGDLLIEVKLTDQINPTDHLKRTKEADFFTFASNGDGYMSQDEATYYIAYLISTTELSNQLRELTEKTCSVGRVDRVGWDFQDPACFRRVYFGQLEHQLDRFPRLRDYYKRSSEADRKVIQDGLEFAGRRYGITDRLIGGVDIQGVAGVLHFIETVFVRFDVDGNDSLNVAETLKSVEVFGKIIADVGGIPPSNKALIEAAFTFTLKKGRVPSSNLGGIAELGLWLVIRPFWSLDVKRADVYKLLPVLIGPPLSPPDGGDDLP